MIHHYFACDLSAAQRERIQLLLPEEQSGLRLTPAMMEQLCAEFDSVDELLDALSQRGAKGGSPSVLRNETSLQFGPCPPKRQRVA